MVAVMKAVKMGMGRRGVRFQEEGREWRLLGILYADYLVLCGEPEEDLRVMVGCFVEMFRGKGLKVNAGKSNVMVFSGEEGLRFEVCVEQVSEFKYLGCVLDKSGTNEEECSRKVVSGRKAAGAIRSLVNAKSLQLQCARVLHEQLLVPVLIYDSETMI